MKLLDLILPVRCVVCGAGGEQLCAACRGAPPAAWPSRSAIAAARRPRGPSRRCRECAGRRLAFASARAAVAYDDGGPAPRRAPGRSAACARSPPRRPTSSPRRSPAPAAAALAFVPPDRARGLERGHHPAERLARELGERWSLPVTRRCSAGRDRPRGSAGCHSPTAGATSPARSPLPRESPARVALVDDVYTSGSTANAAASALRKGGRAPGRGDHVRAGRPLDSWHGASVEGELRCSSR